MDRKERDALITAWRELVARAAHSGLLPAATGVTLREQAERLRDTGRLPAEELERLVGELERRLHAGRAGDADDADLAARIARLGADLPPVPPAPPRAVLAAADAGPGSRWGALLERALPALLLLVVAGGLATAVARAGPGAWAGFGRGGAEMASLEAARGAWSTPSNRPRTSSVSCPEFVALGWGGVGFDSSTGADTAFRGRRRLDPFRPRLNWTHRTFVYPSVLPNLVFARDGTGLREASDVDGVADQASEVFRAECDVGLVAGQAVPVPSPAPDALVLMSSSDPPQELRFVKDAADGLYVVGERTGLASLSYTLATFADYHFAALPEVPFVPVPQELPASLAVAAQQVIAHIGELPAPTYAGTVRRLQAWFGGFAVAPLTDADERGNPYLTLALARKGVCRHRARCFVVTAQALGIPARLCENRTHSFAEVQLPDGTWRRIELRYGDGEDAPVPETVRAREVGAWNPPGAEAWWLLSAVVGLLAGAFALSRRDQLLAAAHQLRPDPQENRAARRARRDADGRLERQAMDRLLDVVVRRVARRLGGDPDDLAGLRAAVDASDELDGHMRHRLRDALALAGDRGSNARPDPSNLQFAYWNSYHVLKWTDTE